MRKWNGCLKKRIDYLRRPGRAKAQAGTTTTSADAVRRGGRGSLYNFFICGSGTRVRRNDIFVVASSASHPGLADIRGLALMLGLLLLAFLLFGAVAPVEATGGSTKQAVMAGVVTGDAADRRALEAALGFGGPARKRERNNGKHGD
jgi:hypothetical protein